MNEFTHELEVLTWAARDGLERTCPVRGVDGRLRTCKRRDCERCGPRWARDWRKSMAANLAALNGPVVLISITAPGAERLPWDTENGRCASRRRHRHRGPDGCRVQERAAREWADTCVWRWQKLREAARIATLRATRHFDGGIAPTILERVWEPQKRGVPHLHLVLPYRTHLEQMAAHAFANELALRAGDYDFGFVDARSDPAAPFGRRLKPIGAEEAAKYLASYLTGRSRRKSSIRSNIADPIMPRSIVWLTPKLTSTGEATASGRPTWVTMRTLRRARQFFAWAKGLCSAPIWEDVFEAARVAVVCRRVFGNANDDDDELDVDGLLDFADQLEQKLGGPVWWKYRCYGEREPFVFERPVTSTGRQVNELFGWIAGLELAAATA